MGRLDVTSGRSSTQSPPTDLRERWVAAPGGPDPGSVRELAVVTVGPDLAVVGDRVLSLPDGVVVAPSDDVLAVPATMAGVERARAGWVAEGRLVTVDAVLGTVLTDVAVDGDGESYGFVAGFVGDLAVVLTWPEGQGPLITGVDTTTGEAAWRVAGDLWAPVGDGWFIGQRAADGLGGSRGFLLDGRTGRAVAPPDLVVTPIVPARVAMLDGGVAWLLDRELAVTDTATGETVWRHPVDDGRRVDRAGDAVRVVSFNWGTAAVTAQWFATGDGRPLDAVVAPLPERTGVEPEDLYATVGDDALVAATGDGIALVERDGPGWTVDLDDVLLVRAVGDGGQFVVVLTGRRAAGGARFVGGLTATVIARDGSVLHTVPVGPLEDGRSWRFVGRVDDDVLVAPARRTSLDRVLGVGLRDGELVTGVDLAADVLGAVDGRDPSGVGAAGGFGRLDPSEVDLVGFLAGGPGAGGPSPVLLHRGGLGVLAPGGALGLGDSTARLGGGGSVAATGGLLALPTVDGTVLVRLPAPGQGAPVDALVGRAVGAVGADATADRREEPVLTVPDVTPLVGIDDVLVGTEEANGDGPPTGPGTASGTVVAVDPVDGTVVWRSELELVKDPTRTWFGQGGDLGDWAATGVVGTGDGAVVIGLDAAVVALDLDDGTIRWRVPLRLADVAPVVVDGLVVVATPTAVVALDPVTGRRAWRHDAGDLVTALDGAGGAVLFGTATGTVRVLDSDGVTADDVRTTLRVDDLAVVDDLLLVAHRNGTVTALGPPPTTIGAGDAVDVVVPGNAAGRR